MFVHSETESWQCLLCVNFSELEEEGGDDDVVEGEGEGLPPRLQRLVERVTLELYCQYESSLPFREPVPQDNLHYHAKITRPMCLDMIRMKLQPRSPARYCHVRHFVADCRLLFRNAYAYNPPDSSIYKDAKRLEEFFEAQLMKWLPEYAAPALTPGPAPGALIGPGPGPGPAPSPAWPEAPPTKRPRPEQQC
ncbi:hypothetical protein evm_010357 [Chilo suppressalis]|nr:hypothetical protein evm_010357 [Chilo suppressalis]